MCTGVRLRANLLIVVLLPSFLPTSAHRHAGFGHTPGGGQSVAAVSEAKQTAGRLKHTSYSSRIRFGIDCV